MPKELIHFKVAEKVSKSLSKSDAKDLSGNRAALLLGAIFHDVFYYVRKKDDLFRAIADCMHGSDGENPAWGIQAQASFASRNADNPAPSAFLVGLISHLRADAVFHPMIWHATGDYYHAESEARSKARQRHRLLETLLDMVHCREMIGKQAYSIRSITNILKPHIDQIIPFDAWAKKTGFKQQEIRDAMFRCLENYALIQELGTNRFIVRAANALDPMLPASVREITALFHLPRLRKLAPLVSGRLEWQNPVTCEHEHGEISALIRTSAQNTVETIFAARKGNLWDLKALHCQPNPDTGLEDIDTKQNICYADPPWPLLP